MKKKNKSKLNIIVLRRGWPNSKEAHKEIFNFYYYYYYWGVIDNVKLVSDMQHTDSAIV